MDIVFLFGTVQAFFLSLLIFSKKHKSTADFVLASWIIFIGLHLLDTYFHFSGLIMQYPHLIGLGHNFPILQGPFMFVYVLIMIDKKGRFKPAYWLHAIPFVVATIYLMIGYYFLSASEKIAFIKSQMIHLNNDFKIIWLFKVFWGPLYVVWSLYKLRTHSKNISEEFSYSEKISLDWLKYVISALGFVWLVVLVTMFLRHFFPKIPHIMTDYSIYLALTVAVFFLGYFGFKQQVIYSSEDQKTENKGNMKNAFVQLTASKQPKERYKKSGLDENTAKEYLEWLLAYMNKEKPYLNGKLSLKDVAGSLGISINHLSQVINEQMGMSFFDFVNKYRVEEIKKRLTDPKNNQYTLLALAFDCGFNSKSSFNNIFKKTTGFTPSEYQRAIYNTL